MENNIIYCGECAQVMRDHIEDNSIDLTVTSPPYDNLRTYNGFVFPFEDIAKELYRVTKPGGVVVWVVADETKNFCESLTSFKQAIYFVDNCGFNLLDTMVYLKTGYPPAYPNLKRYANVFEYMFVFSKNKPKSFNPVLVPASTKESTINRNKYKTNGGFRQKDGTIIIKEDIKKNQTIKATNVWKIYSSGNRANKDTLCLQHPARFPEKLAEDHILSWSNEGDVVFDPMCGSGTTLAMARKNNRQYIGIDISQEYVDLSKQRVSLYE